MRRHHGEDCTEHVANLSENLAGGAHYWHREADASFDLAGTLEIGDLAIVGSRAISRCGSVDCLVPIICARVRYAVAPGHDLFLRGDIGGFGVESDFSWRMFGGYDFDVGTFSGVIGYRALSVDYSQGEGQRLYRFDMLQHGPVLGISAQF